MTPSRERGQRAREGLRVAAERLLLQDGIDGVTTRNVTAEAGLNITMVNYHFGLRDTSVVAVLENCLRELNEARADRLQGILSVETHSGERPSVDALLRAFLEETLSYRWAGGNVRDLLHAVRSAPGEDLQWLRQRILGISGSSAGPMLEALSVAVVGVSWETLRWRWRVAMGELEEAVDLTQDDLTSLADQVECLMEILVPLLTAGGLLVTPAGARFDWSAACGQPGPMAAPRPGGQAFRAPLDSLHVSPS